MLEKKFLERFTEVILFNVFKLEVITVIGIKCVKGNHNYTGRRKKETFIPFNVQKKFEDILKG
jgi:hypothetical protein